jgi:uncharacterized protein (DUF58 family)
LRRLRRLFRFLFVRHRSLTVFTLLFFTTITVAYASGFWLAARLANVILLTIPLAWVWARLNLSGLEVDVQRQEDRLQEGGDFEERISVTNKSWFTKLWLEVEDLWELPGRQPRRVISLPPRATRSWRTVSHCSRRGLYNVGPVQVTTGDLFGLFRRSKTFGRPHTILVYPRAHELTNVVVPPAMLPGEGRFRRPTQQITPNAATLREYQPGDSLNRFHWRSTARTGRLMVKLFELDPASDLWIVLDLEGKVQVGEGDDGTEEHAVRIAASVARYFLLANRSVGFIAFGKQFHLEEPERGLSQYTRILEALALARATGDVPLADLLTHEGRRFGRHTTIVVITPSTDESWVASMQTLAGQGAKRSAIVLEPRTFGGDESALLVFTALAAADVQTYLVKRSDDLNVALGASAESVAGGGRA